MKPSTVVLRRLRARLRALPLPPSGPVPDRVWADRLALHLAIARLVRPAG